MQTTYPAPTHHIIQTKIGAKFSTALDVPVRPECIEMKRINTEISPRNLALTLQKKVSVEYRYTLIRGYFEFEPLDLTNHPIAANENATARAAPIKK